MNNIGTMVCDVIVKTEVKDEPMDEDECEKSSRVSMGQCSIVNKEEMYDDLGVDNVAFGAMQNEEVLPDSFPVPIGCPVRIKEEISEEESPSMPEIFTVPNSLATVSSSDYILPDDGAVSPIFIAQHREVLQCQMQPADGHSATITQNRKIPRIQGISQNQEIFQNQETPRIQGISRIQEMSQNQEIPRIQRISQIQKISQNQEISLKKPNKIDISPVSNENLSEKAIEVLNRMQRIFPKGQETTQDTVSKNLQNSHVNEVQVRAEEVPSNLQTLEQVKKTATQPGRFPGRPKDSASIGAADNKILPSLLQQPTLNCVINMESTSRQLQPGVNSVITVGSSPSQPQPVLGPVVSFTVPVPIQSQQQSLGTMMPVGTVPGQSQQQSFGPVLTIGTAPNYFTSNYITAPNYQQNVGTLISVNTIPGQTQPQILGHVISLGGMPAQTQQQGFGQVMPVATASAPTQQGLDQMMSIGGVPTQAQQQGLGQIISVATVPSITQQQGLGQFMPVANASAPAQQGLGQQVYPRQQVSTASVPTQAPQQGLVPVMSLGTMSVPTSNQGLHHVLPVQTVTTSAPMQTFGSTLAVTTASSAPALKTTTTFPAPGSVSASSSLQAPIWTSASPIQALATVPEPKVARPLMPKLVPNPANVQAPAPGQSSPPFKMQKFNISTSAPAPTSVLKPVQAVAPTSAQVPIQIPAVALAQASVTAPMETVVPVQMQTPVPIQAPEFPAQTLLQMSAPIPVPATPPNSQELFNSKLPVKTGQEYTLPKAFGPVLSESSVGAALAQHQGAARRLLKIALKDFLDFTDDNYSENTRTDKRQNVGK